MRGPDAVRRVLAAAGSPVDSASVTVFRIAFGALMVLNVALYLPVLVGEYYVDPPFHFSYGALEWIRPLPGVGMYLVYVAMGVAGALVAVGRWYRPALAAFGLLHVYVFLCDPTYFQNHEYLIALLVVLMLGMPLHRRWSLDARRHPERASRTVPRGVLWVLRFQIAVPYVYGGLAKLNGDWLRGEPLRTWLDRRTDVEPVASVLRDEGVVWFATYGALVLDLVVVPLLLWRRTRPWAFAVVTTFHLLNAWLFGLFVFPWLMIAATTLFFEPDWPVRLAAWARARWAWADRTLGSTPAAPAAPVAPAGSVGPRRWLVGAVAVWAAVQLLVPLRHLAVEGDPSWNEQAHRFAWHMRLREKQGVATFHVGEGDAAVVVDPWEELGPKQAARLPGHPERLVQYAHHLSARHGGAPVRADTSVSLNGREAQPMVDPTVDLTTVTYSGWRSLPWVVPLRPR